MSFDIRVCSAEDQFLSIREPWAQLLNRSERRSIFLTWEWLEACRTALSSAAELRVVCCYDGLNLVAAAPLVRKRTRYYGVPLTELSFLGDPISDRQFILDSSSGAASAAIYEHLATNPFRVDLLRLEQVPSDSSTISTARDAFPRLAVEYASQLPYISLEGTWLEFERRLSKKFKSEMRTRTKVFESFGSWSLEHLHGPDAASLLDEISAIEQESAKASRGHAFLGVATNRAFLARFMALTVGHSVIPIVSALRIGDRIVAYLLAFLYDNKYHAVQHGLLTGVPQGFSRQVRGSRSDPPCA